MSASAVLDPAGTFRAYPAAGRCSPRTLAAVLALHLAVLAVAFPAGGVTAPPAAPALLVQVLAVPAPLEPAPPVRPSAPRTSVRHPAPAALSPLSGERAAASASTPVSAAASAAPGLPSSPLAASAATPPAASAVSLPRFDADTLFNPAPLYPALARRLGEEGRVLLRVQVDPAGRPSQIEVKQGSGSPRLDQAAVEAVWRWKFIPARQADEAVSAWVQVPVVFNLRG